MESKQQLDKLIDKIQQDLDDAKRKRDELEVTYSIGDRFKDGAGQKAILVKSGHNQVSFNYLSGGEMFAGPCGTRDLVRVTRMEMRLLDNCLRYFTRYWDARKKERC